MIVSLGGEDLIFWYGTNHEQVGKEREGKEGRKKCIFGCILGDQKPCHRTAGVVAIIYVHFFKGPGGRSHEQSLE